MRGWFDFKLYLIIILCIMMTLSSDVNDCNFPNFISTLIVFIVNTPESIWDNYVVYKLGLCLGW